jgi:3-oxoacyl-[acyl-carrier-protein] synthase II
MRPGLLRQRAREMKIEYAAKNNFGFGGTNGTLVFKRV